MEYKNNVCLRQNIPLNINIPLPVDLPIDLPVDLPVDNENSHPDIKHTEYKNLIKSLRIKSNTLKALVFEGGGAKGIAFGGAIIKLAELGYLNDVIYFAGSSAGAIVAAALAVKIIPSDILNIMYHTNFNTFLDDDYGIIRDINRLIKRGGWNKGLYVQNWIENILYEHTGIHDITFKQVLEQYGNTLCCTTSCITHNQNLILSPSTTPDLKVSLAVRMSMGLPIVFVPIVDDINNCHFIDGGIGNNYPITIFDEVIDPCHVLGLKLMGETETADHQINYQPNDIKKGIDVLKATINFLLLESERRSTHQYLHWERTIAINTGHITTMDFDLSNTDKNFLINNGKRAIIQHLCSG